MVLISYSGREINAKLVYYGPGLSGKTTNLEYIYGAIPQTHRGKMVSMKTKTERTLFFDFLPIDLGELAGFKTRFLLYTVPGQVYYNATRKLVLKGVDAVVFVADSKRGKMDENIESLQNLRDNLKEQGIELDRLPWVIQYNKRDLPDTYSVDELQKALNPSKAVPYFEAIGTTGHGVFETFKAVSRLLLKHLSQDIGVRVIPPQGGEEGQAPPVAEGTRIPASTPAATPLPTPAVRPAPISTARPAPIPNVRPAPISTAPPAAVEITSRAPTRAAPLPGSQPTSTPTSEPRIEEVPPAPLSAPPPLPTASDVDFEHTPRSAPPPVEPMRMPGMGDRLRRWLGRSRDFDESASESGTPAPPEPAETAPVAPRVPVESTEVPDSESAPEPFVEPQDEPPVPVELAPAQMRQARAPAPIPVTERREEKPLVGARPIPAREGKPVVREVPVTIEIDPDDLEAGVILKLLIRAKAGRASREDSAETGEARAA